MKSRIIFASTLVVLLAAGCGQKESTNASSSTSALSSAAAPATPDNSSVEVTAGDNMKFSVTEIAVPANKDFKITLTNVGTQPKEVMGHNFVVLKPGTDAAAFATAAMAGEDTDYIPAALKDQVIAHTPLLGPRKSADITVNLPPGEYVFLCTFPAHFQVGMHGKLIVK